MSEGKAVLIVKDLEKGYRNEKGKIERNIISNLSLEVKKNEFLCILGPSGCGKTTLLRCIAGFEAYSGDIYINGKKVWLLERIESWYFRILISFFRGKR